MALSSKNAFFNRHLFGAKIRHLRLLCWGICALLFFRLWYLSVLQREKYLELAQSYHNRYQVIEPAMRGTIRDRFGIPLAMNRMQYNACFSFAQIGHMRNKREYLLSLSQQLGKEWDMDSTSLFERLQAMQQTSPLLAVLKENLSEEQFFKMKIREKDWPGLCLERVSKREYPEGKTAGHVLGYMGAINSRQWQELEEKRVVLKRYLSERVDNPLLPPPLELSTPLQALDKWREIEERMYRISDRVGKIGLEGYLEEDLRGFYGKRVYETNQQRNIFTLLPESTPPLSGKRVYTTLSLELQKYAEELLIKNETVREEHSTDRNHSFWIRGGSILAMDPQSGEVLACASCPRFDPNDFSPSLSSSSDFVRKQRRILLWNEGTDQPQRIWDGQCPLIRERWDEKKGQVYEETDWLTWDRYLDLILPHNHAAYSLLRSMTIGDAVKCQRREREENGPHSEKEALMVDCSSLLIDESLFDSSLLNRVGFFSLSHHRNVALSLFPLEKVVRRAMVTICSPSLEKEAFDAFWEKYRCHFLTLLVKAEQTAIEEVHNPYIDSFLQWKQESEILDLEEIKVHLEKLKALLCDLSLVETIHYLQTIRYFSDLTFPLRGHYFRSSSPTGQMLAGAFYPRYGFGYMRSYAFQHAWPAGSLFKPVIAYRIVLDRYLHLLSQQKPISESDLHPFSFFESFSSDPHHPRAYLMGYKEGRPVPQFYRGGRLIPSVRRNIGWINLFGALENSSNPYFALLADQVADADEWVEVAKDFSFGQKSGIDLPGEYGGFLPRDLSYNKSGLYAFAIGQHEFRCTPLQVAAMFTTFANGGTVYKPKLLLSLMGKRRSKPYEVKPEGDFLYRDLLACVGIDFPLFSQVKAGEREEILFFPSQPIRELPFPPLVHRFLLKGLHGVVNGERGISGIRTFSPTSCEMLDYTNVKEQLAGKSGTPEALETIDIFTFRNPQKCSHTAFACIAFDPKSEKTPQAPFGTPELVVVVYLRFGSFGKEAAPLAAQMVKKWREIRARHGV